MSCRHRRPERKSQEQANLSPFNNPPNPQCHRTTESWHCHQNQDVMCELGRMGRANSASPSSTDIQKPRAGVEHLAYPKEKGNVSSQDSLWIACDSKARPSRPRAGVPCSWQSSSFSLSWPLGPLQTGLVWSQLPGEDKRPVTRPPPRLSPLPRQVSGTALEPTWLPLGWQGLPFPV